MADTLQKSIDVDLSSLDAKLASAQSIEQKTEGKAEQLEGRLKADEKMVANVERSANKIEHKIKHLGRHLLREGIAQGLEELSGVEAGSASSTGLNIISAGASGAAFGPGVAMTAILMTAVSELRSQYADSKRRAQELAQKVEENKQAVKDWQDAKKSQDERDQRELETKILEIQRKAEEATKELIYQSSQYLDQ